LIVIEFVVQGKVLGAWDIEGLFKALKATGFIKNSEGNTEAYAYADGPSLKEWLFATRRHQQKSLQISCLPH